MTFFLKPKNIYCIECVSTHYILGVNQDSTKIFSKAPELSMNLNRLRNSCIIFLAITGNSGTVSFELSPGFWVFSSDWQNQDFMDLAWSLQSNLRLFELRFLTLEIHLSLTFTCCLCFTHNFYSLSVVGTWQSFRAVSVFHLESSLAGWMSTAVWTMKEWETWR